MEIILNSLVSTYAQFNWVVAFGIGVIYFLVDALYAFYTLAVTKKQPMFAATTGALIHFLSALGVLSYIQNYLYVIPIIIGSLFGTYLIVLWEKNRIHTPLNREG